MHLLCELRGLGWFMCWSFQGLDRRCPLHLKSSLISVSASDAHLFRKPGYLCPMCHTIYWKLKQFSFSFWPMPRLSLILTQPAEQPQNRFFFSVYLYGWRTFYNVFLISFARSNTAQLVAVLTFSLYFLTCKMYFSTLISPLFFHYRPCVYSSYLSQGGLSSVRSGVLLRELVLLSEMQTWNTFFLCLWLQESPLQSSPQLHQFSWICCFEI